MKSLKERIAYLTETIDDIMYTSSRIEKESIISSIPDDLKDDFQACLEVLDGRYVFGFKWPDILSTKRVFIADHECETIRDMFELLMTPSREHDLSTTNIENYILMLVDYEQFLRPFVNKTVRLGIGRSLLPTSFNAPMLAKKLEDRKVSGKVYITEKLDGNRCIAYYDGNKWVFKSRNGKLMYVDFDMTGMSTAYAYDGEVLSSSQSQASEYRIQELFNNTQKVAALQEFVARKDSTSFNKTSGTINTHSFSGKDLVYHIFDIQLNLNYEQRRSILEQQKPKGNVIIVPLISTLNSSVMSESEFMDTSMEILDRITMMGGEGLMFNLNTPYEHKRSNNLLKFKKVKTMDMKVVSYELGKGKYEYAVGKLYCIASYGINTYECYVGTGMSDQERYYWPLHPESIVGKIVEVAYFEISQNQNALGTNMYSLRFPRLIKIRRDKNETSTH